MQLKLGNKYLEVLICDGFICNITSKINDSSVIAEKPEIPFAINIRKNVTEDSVTSYGEFGVQTSKRKIGLDGINPLKNLPVSLLSMQKSEDDSQVTAKFNIGEWDFSIIYSLKENSVVLNYNLQYNGAENLYINEASFALPTLKFDNLDAAEQRLVLYDIRSHSCELDTQLSMPIQAVEGFDYIPQMPHRMGAMDCDFHHEIDFLISAGKARLFGWGREQKGETISYTYNKSEAGLSFAPTFWCFDRITPGKSMHCGEFTLTLFECENRELKEKCYAIKRSFDWEAGKVETVTDGCIYQKHGFIADGGGFAEEIKELARLKELGVSIVYLPPLSPPEAYVNDWAIPIAPCYGTAEELRRYTDEAHRLGLKVICDMIIHDLFRGSTLIAKHPEFIRRDELGNMASCFIGSFMTETTNQAFKEYYLGVCKFLIAECGLDGFRFDVGGFQLPGWQLDNSDIRPGMTVAAQTQVLQYLNRELSKIKPIIFLEEGMGVTGLRYVSHGYIPFLRFFKKPEPELLPEVIERFAKLNHYRFLKDRPGVQTMLHLKIHDTVLLQRFGRNIIGGDLALLRWTLTAEGVPFLSDMSELGITDEIKFLLSLRRNLPEFGFGATDYFNVSKNNGNILCFVRESEGEKSLVCINFGTEKVRDNISYMCKNVEGKVIFTSSGSSFLGGGQIEVAENGMLIIKISGEKFAAFKGAEKANKIFNFKDLAFNLTFGYSAFPESSFRDSTRKTFDEGSFSEVEELNTNNKNSVLNDTDNFYQTTYDDSKWVKSFRPSTRQPYSFCYFVPDVPYVESCITWAQNMLWSRDKSLTLYNRSFFRAEFELTEIPKTAEVKLFSPAHYDFDIAAMNFGNITKMTKEYNKVQAFVNGKEICEETERKWEEAITLDTSLLKKGKNLIAFSVGNGFGSHGGCCGIYLNGSDKSIPLEFITMPSQYDSLETPSIKNGEHFIIENAINSKGFKCLKITFNDCDICTLIGENGRVFSQNPFSAIPRVNSYSGAKMPILRSDEFFSINENFSFEIGNIICQSFTPGTIGMIFKREDSLEVIFCSQNKNFELNIKEK